LLSPAKERKEDEVRYVGGKLPVNKKWKKNPNPRHRYRVGGDLKIARPKRIGRARKRRGRKMSDLTRSKNRFKRERIIRAGRWYDRISIVERGVNMQVAFETREKEKAQAFACSKKERKIRGEKQHKDHVFRR